MSADDIAKAQGRAAAARGRLAEALAALKQRLLPRTIAHNLLAGAKDKATDTATAGIDAVKARPAVAVGIAALTALLLARKPIARAISSDNPETPGPPARSAAKRPRKAK